MTIIEAADALSEALDPDHQAIRDYCRTEQEAQEQIRMLLPLAQQEIAQEVRPVRPHLRLILALLQARRALSEVR